MSYYHDVVVWQSPDGTWSMGAYAVLGTCGGDGDDGCGDETHEWCRDFDQDNFEWASTGHPTSDAAWKSWRSANHGGGSQFAYNPNNPQSVEVVAELDDLAAKRYEASMRRREEDRANGRRSWGYDYGYEGPPKPRSLASIQRERLDSRLAWVGTRLGGYANGIDEERDRRLLAQCKERLQTATPAERDAYWKAMADHVAAVRQKFVERDERKAEEVRRNNRYGMYRGYGYGGYNPRAAQDAAARRIRQEAADAEVEAWVTRIETAVQQAAEKKQATEADTKATTAPATPTKTTTATRTKTSPPAKKATSTPAKKAAAPARRKTTAKSTSGSFAAHERGEAAPLPESALKQPGSDDAYVIDLDPWGP